jgi:hydrogenase maturation protease
VLLSDDGFGVEVIRRLEARVLPAHVETLDVGIGGMHFVLRLMEGFQKVVVVDAFRGDQPPGTLDIFALEEEMLKWPSGERFDPHLAEPLRAIQLGKALGCLPDEITLVGCEPENCEPGMSLTAAVHKAIDRAVEKIREMVVDYGDRD